MLTLKINNQKLRSLKKNELKSKTNQDIQWEKLSLYTTFDANYNNLITTDGISEFTGLITLNLSNNKIQFLSQFPHGLIHVDLTGNMIDSLKDKFGRCVFQNAKGLQTLNLSRNRIINLSPDIFIHNKHLKTLNLSNNKIHKNLLFASILDELEVLDLSNNSIKDIIQFQVFAKKLPKIQNIRIKNNPASIPNARRCAMALSKNIPHLKYLDDKDINRVASIPLVQNLESRRISRIANQSHIKAPPNSEANIKDYFPCLKITKKFIRSPSSDVKQRSQSKNTRILSNKKAKICETESSISSLDEESENPISTRSILRELEPINRDKARNRYKENNKRRKGANSVTPRNNLSSLLLDPPVIQEERRSLTHRIPPNNISVDVCEVLKIDKYTTCNLSCHSKDDLKEYLYPGIVINEIINQTPTNNINQNIIFSAEKSDTLNQTSYQQDRKEIEYLKQLNELRQKILLEKDEQVSSNVKIRELNDQLEKYKLGISKYQKLLNILTQNNKNTANPQENEQIFSESDIISCLIEQYYQKLKESKTISELIASDIQKKNKIMENLENTIDNTTKELKNMVNDCKKNLLSDISSLQSIFDGYNLSLNWVVENLNKLNIIPITPNYQQT